VQLQAALAGYGYRLPLSGHYDMPSRDVVTAFQRHFRPQQVDGLADPSTIDTLQRLIAAKVGLCSRVT
jgi:N-acetylmuramoyl-L-alanine amidase